MSTVKPPMWFWVLAVVLLLWNFIGVYFCVQQFRLGADAYPPVTEYDRQLVAHMPIWYNWVFALVEATGVAGLIALLLRRAVAIPLLVVSLLAVIFQFGYVFAATDIIAHKGLWTVNFPLFVAAVCVLQIWLARHARARGWIA